MRRTLAERMAAKLARAAKLTEPKRCTVFKVVLEVVCPDEEDNCPDEKDVRRTLDSIIKEQILRVPAMEGWKYRIKDVQPWATGEAVPE